jgi:HK97 family phage portal protein
MGLMSRIAHAETRSARSKHPRDPVLAEWFGGAANTASGIYVTPDVAMRESAVYACVRVLSESVAQLPLEVYRRRKGGGKDRATDHPLYDLLHTRPNQTNTSFEFREMMMASVLLRGNGVALVIGSGRAGVGALEMLNPDRLTISKDSKGRRLYTYTDDKGKSKTYTSNYIFHIAGMSLDGVSGLSPVTYHRETVGASLSIKEFGARLFANGTHLGTVIEHPGKLSQKAKEHLYEDLRKNWQGVVQAGKGIILEENMKVAKLGMTAEDAQYLDSRKFSRSEIAGIFRVPPHMIGDLEKATFSNIEQQAIEYVMNSLMPWLVRIEQAILRDLITEKDRRKGYFAEFNAMGLLRGDAKARSEYYKARFEMGSITPNQIRALENENPEPNGDTAFVPLNMIPIDQAGRPDTNKPTEQDGGLEE